MPKADLEVQEILREIRRGVLDKNGVTENGANDALVVLDDETAASRDRVKAHLAITERLRTNLPPVTSYRRGLVAKLELWVKGKIKRAMRWIVLDQVNFNSTVHQVLSELHAIQVRQEKVLAALSALQASMQIEAAGQEQRQRLVNDEQRAVNEQQRTVNEEQRTLNEELCRIDKEQSRITEELRLQVNESATIIDRMRRNFEHRLRKLEEPQP